MVDLYVSLVAMTALAIGVFCLSCKFNKHRGSTVQTLTAIMIVAAMAWYARMLWQNTELARWLPVSSLVIIGNWFPLFLAALAGVVAQMTNLTDARRTVVISVLTMFAMFALAMPLLGRSPACGDRWTAYGECVQTTDYTCTAASAATLLRLHGIDANECEMADLCLTRSGTSWLGLYRGLKVKTRSTAWDVEIVRCSASELAATADRPMIIEVGLQADHSADAAFRDEFGWQPGVNHSVVLAGFNAKSQAQIIDPTPLIGREEWSSETFNMLWRGYAVRLVPRANLFGERLPTTNLAIAARNQPHWVNSVGP